MYGDGLSERSARYSDSGSAPNGIDIRCDSTTCMMSPAAMYSLARATAAQKLSRPNSLSARVAAMAVWNGISTGVRSLLRSSCSRSCALA
jgi:hypothetical protein